MKLGLFVKAARGTLRGCYHQATLPVMLTSRAALILNSGLRAELNEHWI